MHATSFTDRPFGVPLERAPIVTVLDLPCPPSVNRTRRLHRTNVKPEWIKAADQLVLAARCKTREPLRKITGQFELRIVFSEKHTRMDLDNGIKSATDYLRRVELITDDSPKYMRKITAEWGHAPEGCRVTITEIVQQQTVSRETSVAAE